MALIEAISPEATRTLIDELAAKYPPELIHPIIAELAAAIGDEFYKALVGRTITVTIEGGAVKVTVG